MQGRPTTTAAGAAPVTVSSTAPGAGAVPGRARPGSPAPRRGWRAATVVVPLAAMALTACSGAEAQQVTAAGVASSPAASQPGSTGAAAAAAGAGSDPAGQDGRTGTAVAPALTQAQRAQAARQAAARKALLEAKRKAAAARAAARQLERARAAQRAGSASRTEAERRAQARRAAAERRRAAAARRPAPTPAPPAPAGGAASPSAPAAAVLVIVNRERAKAGCRPLVVHRLLAAAATAHSKDMATKRYFSHTGRDGRSPFDRIKQAGYEGRMMGENIAAGQTDAAAVMQAWMNSEGHRANILNCGYKEIGIGYVAGGSMRHYWTQNFGSR